MDAPPNPTPTSVPPLPASTTSFTLIRLTPSDPPAVCPHTTALDPLPLLFTIRRSRVVPPTMFDPSIATQSVPLSTIIAVALDPVTTGWAPGAGFTVTVFEMLAPATVLTVIGKLSD